METTNTLLFTLDIETCYESDPCEHLVTFSDGTKEFMDGCEIHQLYKEANLEMPDHFACYDEYYCDDI